MTDASMEYVEALEKECMKSRKTRLESYVQTRDEWSKEMFMSDENKVKFYTGLPSFTILIVIFYFITTHGSRTCSFRKYIYCCFDETATFTMQSGFGIHQSNVSRHFRKWIDMFTD